MALLQQILSFFALLLLAGMFINGWYAITRGYKEYYPDGTIRKRGKIFREWTFFWEKEKPEPILKFYSGAELVYLLHKMRIYIKPDMSVGIRNDNELSVSESFKPMIPIIEKEMDIQMSIHWEEGHTMSIVNVWKKYPDYVFPWWMRDMLASCITCFSSLYSTLFYVFIHVLFRWDILRHTLYGCFADDKMWLAIPLTWVTYCFSLAWLNTVLWKKF